MTNNRIWQSYRDYTREEILQYADNLGVNQLYSRLLINRNIETTEEASNFFSPDINSLHDPMLMADMGKAVSRITAARDQGENIWVYGDYDVDGTTSIALVFSFLRQFVTGIDYYAPDRDKEGYGISRLAIDLATKAGVHLIIALDCGIRSVELIDYASEKGLDFIICDHHEPGEELPKAVAVLDPKRADCSYPFKELCGCGVGFKLVQALCQQWNLPSSEAYSFLDFVAVSIASDLVPMVGENRVLTYHGLIKLNEDPSPGLKMVIEKFINKPNLDVTNVVFMIGPRINAAGRMADAKSAVRLLLAENESEADLLAVELNEYNKTRKGLDADITSEALDMINRDELHKNQKTTVVYNEGWHKGVIGIVASRIMEVHYRPTIVLTGSDDVLVGSARSIEAFNVHDALTSCKQHLIQFGGHKYAAGMKLKLSSLSEFKKAFELSAQSLTESDLTEIYTYDAEIDLAVISEQLIKNLKRFAPHGPGNREPIFLSKNLRDSGSAKTIGGDHSHLRLNVISNSHQYAIGAIAFGMGSLYHSINKGQSFDMLYSIEENNFNGRTSIQLMVKDIRLFS
jgi:single-stranded-DNA-specific exonuclease